MGAKLRLATDISIISPSIAKQSFVQKTGSQAGVWEPEGKNPAIADRVGGGIRLILFLVYFTLQLCTS
jgi:hypothetical protein